MLRYIPQLMVLAYLIETAHSSLKRTIFLSLHLSERLNRFDPWSFAWIIEQLTVPLLRRRQDCDLRNGQDFLPDKVLPDGLDEEDGGRE
jgi:hypothetical protein